MGPKHGNLCQVTLTIQKILTSSNQILNLGSLKTAYTLCTGYILQTQDLLNYNLFYQLILVFFNIRILFQLKIDFFSVNVCIWVPFCLQDDVIVSVCACVLACAYTSMCMYVYLHIQMCVFVCFFFLFLIPTTRYET